MRSRKHASTNPPNFMGFRSIVSINDVHEYAIASLQTDSREGCRGHVAQTTSTAFIRLFSDEHNLPADTVFPLTAAGKEAVFEHFGSPGANPDSMIALIRELVQAAATTHATAAPDDRPTVTIDQVRVQIAAAFQAAQAQATPGQPGPTRLNINASVAVILELVQATTAAQDDDLAVIIGQVRAQAAAAIQAEGIDSAREKIARSTGPLIIRLARQRGFPNPLAQALATVLMRAVEEHLWIQGATADSMMAVIEETMPLLDRPYALGLYLEAENAEEDEAAERAAAERAAAEQAARDTPATNA